MAKPLAAAVARNFEEIIRPLFAFETHEFATPVAETALLLGAGAAESTRAGVADFHLRGGNDEFTYGPPEVKVGFVLDANHRGHALFALFEVKNVVLVGREAIVERHHGGYTLVERLHVAPGEVQVSQTFVFGTSRHTYRVHEIDDPSAVHVGAVREFEAFE